MSCTGLENETSAERALPFAVELGLVRAETVTRTALAGLLATDDAQLSSDLYVPHVRFQYLMAAVLDMADDEISARCLSHLPSGSFHYHAPEMQELAIFLLEQVASHESAPARRAAKLLDQMRNSSANAASGRVKRETARRLYEDFWIPRLELATDIGVFEKPRCEGYSYRFTGARSSTLVRARFEVAASPDDGEADIKAAYRSVANALGFAPIRETALLANANRAERGEALMDLDEAIGAIRGSARDGRVRLVLDRDGRANSFKFLGDDK
jgi:hypothetical protein